jgi:ADP-ribose pyrophosphatase YjhB (NUDIX family)
VQPKWLEWAKQLQAIAQNGLAYSPNPYDVERFQQLREIAVEIIATYSQVEHPYILDLLSREAGYATPKVDVRSGVFFDNKILMVRERSDGCWSLPGGWANIGDTPSQVAARETFEESGYSARPIKLVAVYDLDKQGHPAFTTSIYKLFFLCELVGGEAKTSIETDEVGFFAEDNLPPLSMGRNLPHQIQLLFKHYRNPGLPTEFD